MSLSQSQWAVGRWLRPKRGPEGQGATLGTVLGSPGTAGREPESEPDGDVPFPWAWAFPWRLRDVDAHLRVLFCGWCWFTYFVLFCFEVYKQRFKIHLPSEFVHCSSKQRRFVKWTKKWEPPALTRGKFPRRTWGVRGLEERWTRCRPWLLNLFSFIKMCSIFTFHSERKKRQDFSLSVSHREAKQSQINLTNLGISWMVERICWIARLWSFILLFLMQIAMSTWNKKQ